MTIFVFANLGKLGKLLIIGLLLLERLLLGLLDLMKTILNK